LSPDCLSGISGSEVMDKKPNLGGKFLCQFCFLAITFEPEMPESQSNSQKSWTIA